MKEKVLIVDDQAGVRRLLVEALTMDNYEIEVAVNGIEAIEKIQTFKPNLVLMDMKMPGLNGIETLQELNAKGIKVDVIMMTAYGELEIVEEAKRLGAVAHLTKPFDLLELSQAVARVVRKEDFSNN